MKKLIICFLVIGCFAVSAVKIQEVICNSGDFTITNTANRVSTANKYMRVKIMPETAVILNGLTQTNSSLYTSTGIWYSVDATAPITASNPITIKKMVKYESLTLYLSSTGAAPATVNLIWDE